MSWTHTTRTLPRITEQVRDADHADMVLEADAIQDGLDSITGLEVGASWSFMDGRIRVQRVQPPAGIIPGDERAFVATWQPPGTDGRSVYLFSLVSPDEGQTWRAREKSEPEATPVTTLPELLREIARWIRQTEII
jgi:hypothetical protein